MSASQAQETRAVMAVIEAETKAFWDKDFAAWADCWHHAPYIRITGWWESGGISVRQGWESISGLMIELMNNNPEPNPTAADVRRENINIQIGQDMAWVTFHQYGLETGDTAMDMPGLSYETRILEKHAGNWKIVYVNWLLKGSQ